MKNINLLLISTPWQQACLPSIQLGTLKAYVDQELSSTVTTTTYSAHLDLLYLLNKDAYDYRYFHYRDWDEILFFAAFLKEHLPPGEWEQFVISLEVDPRSKTAPITKAVMAHLEQTCESYIREVILPDLTDSGVNVIGFPLNYYQTYSSLYLVQIIKRLASGFELLFIYGGYAVTSPDQASILRKYGGKGFRIVGEGERKLVDFLKALQEEKKISIPGIFSLDGNEDLFTIDRTSYEGQLQFKDIPHPDYSEYFDKVEKIRQDDPIFHHVLNSNAFFGSVTLAITMEGTRGCFARCDFCSMNVAWKGFRSDSAESIFKRVKELSQKYGTKHIRFADNVCDTWAEKFCHHLIDNNDFYELFFELRVHHPESFWETLAKARVGGVQIGIEALSNPLLKRMDKGTFLYQNIMSMKYMSEFGIDYNFSNLILFHPKSTVSDVKETQRVLEHISHLILPQYTFFALEPGSPLYYQIPLVKRKALVSMSPRRWPHNVKELYASGKYNSLEEFEVSPEVTTAWHEFHQWYVNFSKNAKVNSLKQEELEDGNILITDERSEIPASLVISGKDAELYNRLHTPMTYDELVSLLGSKGKMEEKIKPWLEKKIVIDADGVFLALALRKNKRIRSLQES